MVEATTKEFNKFANHTLCAQHFDDTQDEVRRGDAFGHPAFEFKADHFRDHHGDGLAQHGGFRLNATNTPAKDREAIDHGGVAICANASVGISHLNGFVGAVFFRAGPDSLGQIFQVHLMADACSRRNHAEIVKGLRAPTQEFIAFLVALVFQVHIFLEGGGGSKLVHHD